MERQNSETAASLSYSSPAESKDDAFVMVVVRVLAGVCMFGSLQPLFDLFNAVLGYGTAWQDARDNGYSAIPDIVFVVGPYFAASTAVVTMVSAIGLFFGARRFRLLLILSFLAYGLCDMIRSGLLFYPQLAFALSAGPQLFPNPQTNGLVSTLARGAELSIFILFPIVMPVAVAIILSRPQVRQR